MNNRQLKQAASRFTGDCARRQLAPTTVTDIASTGSSDSLDGYETMVVLDVFLGPSKIYTLKDVV